jgi:hypothetical protein
VRHDAFDKRFSVIKWKQLLSLKRSRIPFWLYTCLARHSHTINWWRWHADALNPESLSLATRHLLLNSYTDNRVLEFELIRECPEVSMAKRRSPHLIQRRIDVLDILL